MVNGIDIAPTYYTSHNSTNLHNLDGHPRILINMVLLMMLMLLLLLMEIVVQ